MSEIKVNSIKGVGASTAAITVNNSDGTCTANITNKPNRNLIINGAMQVAQRGTSSTDPTYATVDRFLNGRSGLDESPTQAQHVLTATDDASPYSEGFRFSYHITNGNQTSGAGADDNITIRHSIEAQDMANSGWNYTSTSSYVTLQFWVKSSVAQNFYFVVKTVDGTAQQFVMETGVLSANSWTKITKTISGNSNLQFDNNSERGVDIVWSMFRGTNRTNNSVSLNTWEAFDNAAQHKDSTTTWYTTNDATFEITGVQLEVSDHASDFQFKSFAEELFACQRYYQRYQHSTFRGFTFVGRKSGSNTVVGSIYGFLPMRTAATGTVSTAGAYRLFRTTDGSTHTSSSVIVTHENFEPFNVLKFTVGSAGVFSTGNLCIMFNAGGAGDLQLDAEL